MTPGGDWPCPMCNGRGRGGRAAGVPPDRYADWICGRWRPDGQEGAKARTDEKLGGVFG